MASRGAPALKLVYDRAAQDAFDARVAQGRAVEAERSKATLKRGLAQLEEFFGNGAAR